MLVNLQCGLSSMTAFFNGIVFKIAPKVR